MFSISSLISPNVTRANDASTHASNKLPSPCAHSAILAKHSFTLSLSLAALISFNLCICDSLTFVLSICNTSTGSSFSSLNLFTPIIISSPESIFACFFAAASSILNFALPSSILFNIPPLFSISLIIFNPLLYNSSVNSSIIYDPAHGSITFVIFVSFCIINCVFLAILADVTVGKPNASSKLFVCNDCVPPNTDDNASIVVLIILLYGSCSVNEYPDV
mmetsp:Transcript_61937/g.75927  ORF Transcript_61937/g.75927 Transcript_61937/m.75927 type:complete len:220 (-) Transcript_61937:630-1289(-)